MNGYFSGIAVDNKNYIITTKIFENIIIIISDGYLLKMKEEFDRLEEDRTCQGF